MAIILRLQGLDERAGAEDIRTFFECLHIPEGGVFIVGGSHHEAFVAFTSERDAQLAMRQSGTFLKGSRVTLHISSMEEMEHRVTSVIEKRKADNKQRKVKRTEPSLKADCPPLKKRPDTHITTLPAHTPKQPPSTSVQMPTHLVPKQPPPTSGQKPTHLPPTSGQMPTHLPPTTGLKPAHVPPTTGQKPTHMLPTSRQKPARVPPTTKQKHTHVPPTTAQMPPHLPPTSRQKPTHLLPTTGQKPTHLPPSSVQMPTQLPHTSAQISTQLPYTSEQTPTQLPYTLMNMAGSIGIQPPEPPEPDALDPQTSDLRTAFLLGVCTVLQGLQGSTEGENNEAVPTVDPPMTDNTVVSNEVESSGYVRLFGLPASVTKEDIDQFFNGLTVQEITGNIKMGRAYGCLVRFASLREASEALLYDQQLLGGVCVAVRTASEKMWTRALHGPEDVKKGAKPQQFPPQPSANKRQARPTKRPATDRLDNLAKTLKPEVAVEAQASPTVEYIIKVSNLPTSMTKTQIKEFLGSPKIPRQNIQHLLDKERNMTDTTFVIFNSFEDYEYAINLSGCHVGSNVIEISDITREIMKGMQARSCPKEPEVVKTRPVKPQKKKSSSTYAKNDRSTVENPADRTCLFVRNLPADIQKSELKSLFYQYKVQQDKIFLLYDSKGRGTGEAVVQFDSHKLAEKALSLHGQTFWGTEVLLASITAETMKDLLLSNGVSA